MIVTGDHGASVRRALPASRRGPGAHAARSRCAGCSNSPWPPARAFESGVVAREPLVDEQAGVPVSAASCCRRLGSPGPSACRRAHDCRRWATFGARVRAVGLAADIHAGRGGGRSARTSTGVGGLTDLRRNARARATSTSGWRPCRARWPMSAWSRPIGAGLDDPERLLLAALSERPAAPRPVYRRHGQPRRHARSARGGSGGERHAGTVLLAGDAAGFVDPMTGDGLRFAVEGGELAARAAHADAG